MGVGLVATVTCPRGGGLRLASGPAWLPPQELRPAPWRASLAPADVWERFDEAVAALSRAGTEVSVVAISQAFGQLSSAAWELADAVEKAQRQRATRLADRDNCDTGALDRKAG